MRKKIVVAVIFLAVASAGAFIYFYQPFTQPMEITSILPADTASLIRVSELKKQIERFKNNKLGRSLAGIDLRRLMNTIGVPQMQQQKFVRELENFNNAVDSAWFEILFGQDVAVALLDFPFQEISEKTTDIRTFFNTSVIVARPSQPTRVLKSLKEMFSSELSVESKIYQQWEINSFSPQEGITVNYALANGLLIAGFSAAPVKRCLDQSLDQDASFLNSQAYQRYGQKLYKPGKTNLIAYADISYFMEGLKGLIDPSSEPQSQEMLFKAQLEKFQGIKSFNYVIYDDDGPVITSKAVVAIDRENLSSILAQKAGIPPGANPTLDYVPANVLFYTWSNNFDLKKYWQETIQGPGMDPRVEAQIKQAFADNMNMALEDVLSALGIQTAFLINDIKLGGIFPIPEFAFMVEVRQPERIDRLLKENIEGNGILLNTEDYNDKVIRSTMLPLGQDLSPAYTIFDGFCYIAVNRNLLKRILDRDAKERLQSHADFQAIDKGLSSENNQVFYLKFDKMVGRARSLMEWAMAWSAITKPEESQRIKQIVNLGVNPLLDGLTLFKTIGGHTRMGESQITSDIYILLDRQT